MFSSLSRLQFYWKCQIAAVYKEKEKVMKREREKKV